MINRSDIIVDTVLLFSACKKVNTYIALHITLHCQQHNKKSDLLTKPSILVWAYTLWDLITEVIFRGRRQHKL